MIPHAIRLRQPWEELPAEGGRIRFRRSFQQPTHLDAWERVVLEVDRTLYAGEIALNGTAIGSLEQGQFFAADVTALLRPSNELIAAVDPQSKSAALPPSQSFYIVEADEPLGSPIGDVRLVIRTVRPE